MEDPYLNDPELADPDAGGEAKYSWDKEFQRHIAALVLSDRQFMLQSLDLIKASYFTDKAHNKAISIATEFFKKYRILPRKDFIITEMKSEMKNNKALPYYLGEVNVLFDYFQPGMEAREYLQDKITYFAKIQSVKKAFTDSMKLIDKEPESEETWNKIYDNMRDAMTTHQNFEIGIDYFKSIKDRYAAKAEEVDNKDRFILGLPSVDERVSGGGYCRGEIISIVAGSGVGKCFRAQTPILMFNGTIKSVEEIEVGDLVMGDDSTPRTVLKLVRGRDQMYDVIPKKGDKYTVNSHHVLSLKSASKTIESSNRCTNLRYHSSKWRDGDIFDIPLSDYLKQSKRFKSCMKGYRVGVAFPEAPVKINPYILGIWLGDETSRLAEITTEDYEILNELWKASNSLELSLIERGAKGNASTYAFVGTGEGNHLMKELRQYNLIQNKHVPQAYKANSREIRLQILAGLMDSDGSKSNNCFDFINKNKQLAKDVLFLARSLGLAAYMKPSFKKCQGFAGDIYWRVTISGNTSEVPVRIPRKKCEPREQIKDVLSTGISVVPVGEDDYYGFETNGNHRFLLGDFTVVHNSVELANIVATNCLRNKKGVYISLELGESKIADRLDAIFTGLPVQCLMLNKDQIFEKLTNFKTVTYDGEIWPLVIKQFSAGTATINTIRAYLSQLRFHGFDPDFFVLDYVGEMALHPELKTHESREKTVRELRALATEENMFGATAMQPNRDAKKEAGGDRSRIDDQHLADAFGQIRPLDGCISLNQNDNEKKLGIGRGYVIKQRDGESRYQFYLKFNKESLQITEITQQEYVSILNAHVNHVSEEIKIDEQIDKIVNSGRKFGDGDDDSSSYVAEVLEEVCSETVEEDYGATT